MESNADEKQNIRHRMKLIQRFLNIFLIGCAAYLLWYRWDTAKEAQKNEELWEIAWQTTKKELQKSEKEAAKEVQKLPDRENGKKADLPGPSETNGEDGAEGQYMAGFDELLSINPDVKGWLSIPGTALSLPVVQGADNDYYLKHDFYGKKDRHGTIFIDCDADFGNGEINTVFYGHNMKDGSMFGSLRAYREEDYYKKHPSFAVYLPDKAIEYEILAVLKNDILPEEGLFQYYDYKQIENEEMFDRYYKEIKKHSLYETGVEARYGDELVTLCTCDYGSEDQRLLVVGRKKQDQE